MDMDRQSREEIANIDDELKVFVRSPPQDLEPGALDRVAGGGRSVLVPIG
jgi:hypothetical protein